MVAWERNVAHAPEELENYTRDSFSSHYFFGILTRNIGETMFDSTIVSSTLVQREKMHNMNISDLK